MSGAESHRWESVREACELLCAIAQVQHETGAHPLAGVAAQWLDHIGGVAAYKSASADAPGRLPAAFIGSDVVQ